jgi:predicted nucleic acid-binding protein
MATPLLIDTDVLIEYLRDYPAAVSYVEVQQERFLLSVVTVAELYAGVREGEERARLEQFLRAFEIIPLALRLAVQGGLYRRDYSTSHNVGLADALIAAPPPTRWRRDPSVRGYGRGEAVRPFPIPIAVGRFLSHGNGRHTTYG